MRTYSAFFQTLHDEEAPTGHLGRGTHYSVLRAVVFHDPAGKPLPEAQHADFAVIWDEDHDDRVIRVIERVYRAGLLPSFAFFGERKGMFTAILDERVRDRPRISLLQDKINRISQGLDEDPWPGEVVELQTANNPIISDNDDKVSLYLRNIAMLWQLGIKKPEEPRRDSSIPLHLATSPGPA